MAAAALALQRHAAALVLRPMTMPGMAAASEAAHCRTVTSCALPRNPAGYSVMEEAKRHQENETELMGRGDKRTRKGKIFAGSFGNSRPKNGKKRGGISFTPLPPSPPKKDDSE
eukprot:TRINITY_DN16943_c0_g1_i1.p1 TRINITY_DN16943_c0_g1~~TRINITY_DN16943_c0_g1_i1.p1  ORF type:complete len:114 (+),score=9.48 TRINITY_DN16943_c0_g1_i1:129-470(+)